MNGTEKINAKVLILAFSLIFTPLANGDNIGLSDRILPKTNSDGQIQLGFGVNDIEKHVKFSYQTLPWLTGSLNFKSKKNWLNHQFYFDLRAQLFEQSVDGIDIFLGKQDVLNQTNEAYSYLVANSKLSNLTVSVGYGIGVSHSVQDGFFGSLSYQLNSLPITMNAAYQRQPVDAWQEQINNSATADGEVYRNITKMKSPWSVGAAWQVTPKWKVSIDHKKNDYWGLSVNGRFDTNIEPATRRNNVDEKEWFKSLQDIAWQQRLKRKANEMGIRIIAFEYSNDKLTIECQNRDFSYWPNALDILHSLARKHVPKDVEYIYYLINENNWRLHRVRLPVLRNIPIINSQHLKTNKILLPPLPVKFPDKQVLDWHLSFGIDNKMLFIDNNNPLQYQTSVISQLKIELPNGWGINSKLRLSALDNLDHYQAYTDEENAIASADYLAYLRRKDQNIDTLYIEHSGTSWFADEALHHTFYAGHLNMIYSGLGADILYQPYRSRLAFGASIARVTKRSLNANTNESYLKSALLSGYWSSPFYGYDVAIHLGQFFAEDVGGTLEVRRTFHNGWQVGLWSTWTNYNNKKNIGFKRGSDRGLFVRIPLSHLFDWGGNYLSKKTYIKNNIRTVPTDSGARLTELGSNIWWRQRDARYDVFY
ncbi:YjbH domain-containing protein [Paraglaciecola sp.]|nr:YjbH domain-containing protein [Paraglaciecola sp.]